MLTGTPLDIGPFGVALVAVGWLYWLLAVTGLWWALVSEANQLCPPEQDLPVPIGRSFNWVTSSAPRDVEGFFRPFVSWTNDRGTQPNGGGNDMVVHQGCDVLFGDDAIIGRSNAHPRLWLACKRDEAINSNAWRLAA